MNTNTLPTYLIQQWLFTEAEGKFEIDLGESGVQHQYLSDISYNASQDMNYGLDVGDKELRNILANYYNCSIQNVCITHGGQEALYLFYRSFLKPEDHVVAFTPGWSQSWVIPEQIGCKLSIISLKHNNNFDLDIKEIENVITTSTKLIILNYPNNPTGVNLSTKSYEALINLCNKNNIFILNDEEYLYEYSNSITNKSNFSGAVGSLSKIYGFPATRIGWFIGPIDIVRQITNYKRYTTVCNSNLCEVLAVNILREKNKHIDRYKKLVSEGLTILEKWCTQHPVLKLIPPQGTPFAYISLPDIWDGTEFCKNLLFEKKVLLMPASVFGYKENGFRITFARKKDILIKGLDRISDYLNQKLKGPIK